MDLFKMLLKYPLETFGEGKLVFRSGVPGEVFLVLALAAAALVWLMYRKVAGRVARRSHRAVLGLRILLVATVFFLLAAPALSIPQLGKNTIFTAVLVDTSRSMAITDADAAGKGRFEAARELLAGEGKNEGLLKRLGENTTVIVYAFDRDARRVTEVGALSADGPSTNIFRSVRDVEEDLRGLSVSSVVMLTDGCRNEGGNTRDAAELLKRRGIPMHIVGLGNPTPPKDYEVSRVFAPHKVRRNTEVEVYATVRHTGFDKPFDVTVSRKGLLAKQTVFPEAGSDIQQVRVKFTPDVEGSAVYKVSIAPADDENLKDNNFREVAIDMQDARLPVLYIEGSPRLEYRFLRRALYRDHDFRLVGLLRLSNEKPADATGAPAAAKPTTAPSEKLGFYVQGANVSESYLDKGFPTDTKQLYAFEALILGDIEAEFFTPEQLKMIEEFVRVRGGGVLMLGGVNSFGLGKYAGTPVEKMLPVAISPGDPAYSDAEFKPALSDNALSHPLMRLSDDPEVNKRLWEKVPPLIGVTPVGSLKLGATPLLANDTGRLPVLAVQNYGQGRVASFTSGGSWYWQVSMPASDEFHERFWKQMVRWLVVGVKERVTAETTANVYARGDAVFVRASVRAKDMTPVNDAKVIATIAPAHLGRLLPSTAPADDDLFKNAVDVKMDWILSEEGVYQCRYVPPDEGDYLVRVRVEGAGWSEVKPAETSFRVSEPLAEFNNVGLKRDVLAAMAELTGGKYYSLQEASVLPDNINKVVKAALETASDQQIKPLWDMPLIFGVILLGLGLEWFIRRRSGLA